MLMMIGSAAIGEEVEARQAVAAVAAGLCAESVLSGCIAALPTETQERDWLLSFLSSVKHAASVPTRAVISGSAISAADLIACEISGLNEVIIVQDDCSPGDPIAGVRAYRQARPLSTMGIRIWLEKGGRSGFQTLVCQWKHGTEMLAGVERSPFWAEEVATNEPASAGHAQPLRCEWMESAFTLTYSGAVVPCPAHIPAESGGYPVSSASELLERHGKLLQTAGSHPLCSSCHRLARFVGADCLDAPSTVRPFLPQHVEADPQYQDHVGWDASAISVEEQDGALWRLVSRVQELGGGS